MVRKVFSCLLIIILFSISNLMAQNWNLIRQNERYHYQVSNDTIPLHTIFIDSLKVLNGDSVYYLNRFFLPCDTCPSAGYFIDNQPGFLQRQIRKTEKGLFVIENPVTAFIQVTGTVGDVWWFDKEQTKKAKVELESIESVFGVSDSVMTISVNNESQIKISKEFGLLTYFDYTLTGLEFADLGIYLPSFKEIYDFKVGDVFQYEYRYLCPDPNYSEGGTIKRTVLDINQHGDSLIVSYDEKFRSTYCPWDGKCAQRNYSKPYINKLNHLTNSYPFQKIGISYQFDEYNYQNIELGENVCYTYCKIINIKGKITKEIGYKYYNEDQKGPFVEKEQGLFGYPTELWDFPHNWYWNYQLGVGASHADYGEFEVEYNLNLIGTVKGTDTTGTVYSESYMLGVDESNPKSELTIYPNPASDKILISGVNSFALFVSIFDIGGQLVKESLINGNQEIWVSDLQPGVYLVKIESNLDTSVKQLIIYRP